MKLRGNQKHLVFARSRLSLGPARKQDVFNVIADLWGETRPTNKRDGYALVTRFFTKYKERKPQAIAPQNASVAKPQRTLIDVNSDAFLLSYEWRRLRMQVIKERGARCECCGACPKDGIVIHVDHIKPRRKYPELALTKANLQVLCEVCNHGKGSWDETDWRADSHNSRESLDPPVPRSGDGDGHNPVVYPRLHAPKKARNA